jgi:hypothetical protein
MASISFHDISVPNAQLKAMTRKAKFAGTSAAKYVRLLIERDLLADKSFDEILDPIRRDF